MGNVQPGILAPVPKLARYLNFSLKAGVKPRHALLHRLNWQTAIKSWSGSASRPSLRWERPSPVYGLFRPILARAWAEGTRGGLNFVAFGKSFDAFEAQLKRMVGAEDGITDALFKFTSAISGSY